MNKGLSSKGRVEAAAEMESPKVLERQRMAGGLEEGLAQRRNGMRITAVSESPLGLPHDPRIWVGQKIDESG